MENKRNVTLPLTLEGPRLPLNGNDDIYSTLV